MKHLLISILALGALMSSQAQANNMAQFSNKESQVEQKELKTKNDYAQMVKDLTQASQFGDPDSMFYLGFIHLNDITTQDGTVIEKDEKKAIDFLNKAIALGSKKAMAVKIAKYIESKNITEITNTVKVIQNSAQVGVDDKDYYTLLLAGYLLDENIMDARAIEVSMKWLFEAEKKRPTPKMQFILAFMYQKINNIDAATYYLNKSCVHESMKDQCKQFQEGIANEQSCKKF